MIFHKPDTTFKTLKSCWKRAAFFAEKNIIDINHPLAVAWDNCKLFLDASDGSAEDITFNLVLLDGFAQKVGFFAKDNMIDGDSSLAGILYEWRSYMPCNPTLIR
jgi:hypothetical protein